MANNYQRNYNNNNQYNNNNNNYISSLSNRQLYQQQRQQQQQQTCYYLPNDVTIHYYSSHTSDSSDYGSPLSSNRWFYRKSLLVVDDNDDSPAAPTNTKTPPPLPQLHDQSWIGARLSPIKRGESVGANHLVIKGLAGATKAKINNNNSQKYNNKDRKVNNKNKNVHNSYNHDATSVSYSDDSNDDDDDETDGIYNELYGTHRGSNSNSNIYSVADERTTLMGNKSSAPLHPLWKSQQYQQQQSRKRPRNYTMTVVCTMSCIQLSVVTANQLYQHFTTTASKDSSSSSTSFNWSTFGPSTDLLIRYGALERHYVLGQETRQYWRLMSSMVVTTSWYELIYLLLAWQYLRSIILLQQQQLQYNNNNNNNSTMLFLPFLVSGLTGQVWMLASATNTCIGAATWGLAGLLCFHGMCIHKCRGRLFITSIISILLALLQCPNYNSVYGAVGGAWGGWVLAVALSIKTNNSVTNSGSSALAQCNTLSSQPTKVESRVLLAQVILLAMVVFPVLYIALYLDDVMEY